MRPHQLGPRYYPRPGLRKSAVSVQHLCMVSLQGLNDKLRGDACAHRGHLLMGSKRRASSLGLSAESLTAQACVERQRLCMLVASSAPRLHIQTASGRRAHPSTEMSRFGRTLLWGLQAASIGDQSRAVWARVTQLVPSLSPGLKAGLWGALQPAVGSPKQRTEPSARVEWR